MDLFNTKKLVKNEGKLKELEIQNEKLTSENQKLQEELSELKAKSEKLSREIKEKQQMHSEVVDTLIREIQDFMLDNYHSELSFKTLDTLFPLIKEQIDNRYLKITINLDLPSLYGNYNEKSYEELSFSISNFIIEEWTKEGIIERGVTDDVFLNKDLNYLTSTENSVLSKYKINDVILFMKTNQSDLYTYKLNESQLLTPMKSSIKKVNNSISVDIRYYKTAK